MTSEPHITIQFRWVVLSAWVSGSRYAAFVVASGLWLGKDYNMISYDISKTAERIKDLRKKAGYTQEQVADLLNVDRRTISNIEGGRKGCSVDMLLRFSELYGVTLD